MAEACLAEDKTTEAGLLLERSLYILAKAPGAGASDLARVQESLGMVRTAQQRYAEAESLLKQVLTFREKTLGPDNPDVAAILEKLARLAANQTDYSECESRKRRALEIRVRASQNSAPKLVKALSDLADFESECRKTSPGAAHASETSPGGPRKVAGGQPPRCRYNPHEARRGPHAYER